MNESGLSPMRGFHADVHEGDLIRVVFEGNHEMAGYAHFERVPQTDPALVRVRLSVTPRMPDRSRLEEQFMYQLGDEFEYVGPQRTDNPVVAARRGKELWDMKY